MEKHGQYGKRSANTIFSQSETKKNSASYQYECFEQWATPHRLSDVRRRTSY
ncbi:hypothetical protein DPMN_089415 [Dreissena polymorpha]|uniref:Uncharacterized protein n=1 Tax=Dreissena polymorpha TaxID=45954 RepID=A0A9D4KWC7_DREPO|nr:hypothetical protein DPMN_089415 [Dreissena polymorpha]